MTTPFWCWLGGWVDFKECLYAVSKILLQLNAQDKDDEFLKEKITITPLPPPFCEGAQTKLTPPETHKFWIIKTIIKI